MAIEYLWAEGNYDRLPSLAADFVSRKVDVIAGQSDASALAAKSATSTIPIVFVVGADPVVAGLVASLARPGGNLTGVGLFTVELIAKRRELISELVPQADTIALLVNPSYSTTAPIIRDAQEAARAKGVQLQILSARSESEIDAAFTTLVQLRAGALVVGADPFFASQRRLTGGAGSAPRCAGDVFLARVAAAGLISYAEHSRHIARPASTPDASSRRKAGRSAVQQPTTFELVVNLNTAKALGLTVPSILARADEVIE